MAVPRGYVTVESNAGTAVVREDLAGVPLEQMWAAGDPLAGASGRAGVRRFRLVGERGAVEVVARDYRRGGVFGRWLGLRYFDGSRASRELAVTAALQERRVPVVVPIAALAQRRGPTHRLRLLTEYRSNAAPLPEFVRTRPDARRDAVREAGRVVAAAFAAGLVHRDLHPDNLLARSAAHGVEVRLIDMDRAELRASLSAADQDSMLLRMARYLWRHAHRLRASRTDTTRFLAGFGLPRTSRREVVERLGPRLARIVARHRFSRGNVRS